MMECDNNVCLQEERFYPPSTPSIIQSTSTSFSLGMNKVQDIWRKDTRARQVNQGLSL